MSFFALLVRRPVAVVMIAIAAAVFGFVSYLRLPLTLMPDLSYPTITVRTEIPGAAPEEVETQVSRPVEEALATTEGLVQIESRSRAGLSDVVLQFTWGTNMDRASQDVRERMQTTFLVDGAERPLILRYDPTLDPILRVALSYRADAAPDAVPDGDAALLLLREVAEREIKRDLEAMDGVAAVRVRGGLEREIVVALRQDWMAARDVNIDQVVATLGAENINLPGGSVYQGEQQYLVRTLNEVRSLDEVRALEIRRADGVRVPIGEVAEIREGHKDREVNSKLDGQEAVELEVFKTADANVVRVARAIKARLGADQPAAGGAGDAMAAPGGMPGWGAPATLASQLPQGMTLTVLDDQAAFIESALSNLNSTLLLGALLSVAILYLFLRNWRATAIIGLSIPLSLICTFAPLYIGGVSLNLMSLGGLALGVGMLVDNAVVVLEAIQVHLDAGKGRWEAAEVGVREVAAAVTASTLTTVAVFLPIAFVEGMAGQIFGDLSLSVVFSLLASLLVALFFVPVLAAVDLRLPDFRPALKQVPRSARFRSFAHLRAGLQALRGWRRIPGIPYVFLRFLLAFALDLFQVQAAVFSAGLARGLVWLGRRLLGPPLWLASLAAERFQAIYKRFADRYAGSLGGVLARPGAVMGFAALGVAVALGLGPRLGQALIPEVHQGRFIAELALPVGTPLGRTTTIASALEAAVRTLPDVTHVHTTVGAERRADSKPDEGEHTARLSVQLRPGGDLEAREDRAMEGVRAAAVALAEQEGLQGKEAMELRLSRPALFSFQTPVEVMIYDPELDALRAASDRVVGALAAVEGLRDVRSSLVDGYPEVRIRYDRALLHRFGLDTGSVARRVQDQVQGEQATTLARGEGRVDLLVRLDEDERRGVEELRHMNVNPNLSPAIPLDAVASFEEGEGPSEIRRVDQRRAAVVTANVEGFDLASKAAAVAVALGGLDLGTAEWAIAGQNLEMQRSLQSLQFALALAIFLVYVIMASTFESVLHPFVILFSLPLALVGVVAALWLSSTPVSVVVLIGAIVLAGVVVNNAIVLVDAINRLREEGFSREEAIERAAALRLRPILITTLTTVLGLVPLALGLGAGSEVQRPLALTIIAGLSSSTLLTLGVIPVVYALFTRWLEPRAE